MGFLTAKYYGNTILDWSIAFGIVLASVILAKIVYWISGNVFKKLASKTETKLDDIIVDMVEEPVVFAITIIGLWWAAETLTLSQEVKGWIGKVYHILIAINIAWLVERLIDSLFEEYLIPLTEKTETDLDDIIVPVVRKGVKVIIWSIGIIVGLNNAGYNVGAILAGLGIGGLALAMAAKDTISNIFGGVTILVDQPFKSGDKIEIKNHEGKVKEIGLRSTRLENMAGRLITIPNSYFAENPVENKSAEPSRKISFVLRLKYDTPSEKVEEAMTILKEICTEHASIGEPVLTSFVNFGESALEILLIYFILKEGDILQTQTDVNMQILKRYEAAKIQFAYPTRTVHIQGNEKVV
ncbi:MAG: mechanosensitive ion channel family protein [Leptospiraceae bacterium]|nr:mechanosensitive ion channel family protein [Leptospiraceae bacterium]MCP5501672.1 mechanosensitive ion channel family protein [Leptospiraceae bacterium]